MTSHEEKNLSVACLKSTRFQGVWDWKLHFITRFPDTKSFINYVEDIYVHIYVLKEKIHVLNKLFFC